MAVNEEPAPVSAILGDDRDDRGTGGYFLIVLAVIFFLSAFVLLLVFLIRGAITGAFLYKFCDHHM